MSHSRKRQIRPVHTERAAFYAPAYRLEVSLAPRPWIVAAILAALAAWCFS